VIIFTFIFYFIIFNANIFIINLEQHSCIFLKGNLYTYLKDFFSSPSNEYRYQKLGEGGCRNGTFKIHPLFLYIIYHPMAYAYAVRTYYFIL